MINLPHVTWLRSFEAAARHNSFSTAADELGLTPAAVSQQIRLLEQALKVKLFERLSRGVRLTDIGQAYASSIIRSFSDMKSVTQGLFSVPQKRVVRVRAAISCAALIIAPRLARFHIDNPDISIQLSTSVWADRFNKDDCDVDLRYGYGEWNETSIRHLGQEHAIIVCHPEFAASFGDKLDIQTLAQKHVVKIVGFESDWYKMSEHFKLNLTPPVDWCKTDSSLIALQTVLSGTGSTIVLESFARRYLEQGQLIAPLKYRLPVRQSHYLVEPANTKTRDEVLIFNNWVASLYQELCKSS